MDITAFSTLKELLPLDDTFIITWFSKLDWGFESTIRLKLTDKESVMNWRREFQEKTLTTYRRSSGTKEGQHVLFKEYLYCHHGSRRKEIEPKKRTPYKTKQTKCMAKLVITLKAILEKKRYVDEYMPEWPCEIHIKWIHNHVINATSALEYRDVGDAVKVRMMALFHEGHSPATAHAILRKDVADTFEDQLYLPSDRRILPKYDDVRSYYLKHFQEKYGAFTGTLSLNVISCAIQAISEKSQSKIQSKITEDCNLIVAIVTPLMMRVHHHHPQSGELVFVHSSGGMDEYNIHVFLLMTSSSLGGLPLGCLLTTSETESTIKECLRLFIDMLPSTAFYGRGERGPQIIMTGNSFAEKEALRAIFPETTQYLSIFHVLQATWQHLWDTKSGVLKQHRSHILNLMKGMLYSISEESLEEQWRLAMMDSILSQYDSMKRYFMSYWSIRHQWALCFQQEAYMRGSNTINLVERAFITLKDNILRRQMVWNIVQLVDSIDHLSRYFSHTLAEMVRHSDNVNSNKATYKPTMKGSTVLPDKITSLGEDMYAVQGADDSYTVNSLLGLCTCPTGLTGAACKHQFAVRNAMGFNFLQHVPVIDESERLRFYKMATEHDDPPGEWFKPQTSQSSHSMVDTIIDGSSQINSAPSPDSDSPIQITFGDGNRDDVIKCLQDFDRLCKRIKEKVKTNPEELSIPLTKFVERGNELLSSDLSALTNSLSTFGAGLTPRPAPTDQCIMVQPTTIAPQRHFCGSRSKVWAPTAKGKSKKRVLEKPSILPHQSKQARSLHNLSDSVRGDINLGHTHDNLLSL